MWQLLESFENLGFFAWVREANTIFAYATILAAHAIGMALLVGAAAMISLRVLGFVAGIPLAAMEKFFRVLYVGFWINALSGFVLFAQAATSFVTNPVFYVKMLAIAGAIVSVRLLRKSAFDGDGNMDIRPMPLKAKVFASASLLLWGTAVVAGRLTAYDGPVVWQTVVAVLLLAATVFMVRYAASRIRNPFRRVDHARGVMSSTDPRNS